MFLPVTAGCVDSFAEVVDIESVSVISWLSVLYAINGRKVTVWILYRYEMSKI